MKFGIDISCECVILQKEYFSVFARCGISAEKVAGIYDENISHPDQCGEDYACR